MERSSLRGIDCAALEAGGRDIAALGPSDRSDSISVTSGIQSSHEGPIDATEPWLRTPRSGPSHRRALIVRVQLGGCVRAVNDDDDRLTDFELEAFNTAASLGVPEDEDSRPTCPWHVSQRKVPW